MANTKISALTSATTPLAGTEVLPIVQSSATVKVAVSDLTAGRAVSALTLGVGVTTPVSVIEASSTTPVITASQSSTAVLIDTIVGAFNAYSYDSTVNSKGGVGGVRVYSEATWNTGGTPSYLAFYTHPSSANNNTLLGGAVEAGRFDSSGNLKLAIGNLVVGTSGKGIDFAATAGTGTSELLADYEEGTWTPIFSPAAGAFTSVTYASTGGYYTKVGRLVCVTGRLRTNGITVGTASGSLFIGGLPFTSASTTSAAQGGTLTVADPGGWTVNNPCFGFVSNGATTILIQYRTTANGAAADSNVTDLGLVGLANNLAFTAYYFTA